MNDQLFQINHDTIKVVGIAVPVITVLGYLTVKLIENHVQRNRDERLEFRTAYLEFAGLFTHTLQQLETGGTTLNVLILNDFPKHDLARRDFIKYLRGARKRKFETTWQKYEEIYYQINGLGVFSAMVAIAPSTEDLSIHPSPARMEKWERDRRIELHGIINSLLEVSKTSGWL